MTRRRLLGLVAAAGFVAACAVVKGGIVHDEQFGDVSLYAMQAKRMVDGEFPYRDFFVEYPPGSLLAFILPGLVSLAHYATLFKTLMALFGAGIVLLTERIAAQLGYSFERTAVMLGALVLAPFAIGPLVVNEYDLLPALMTSAALLALLRGRHTVGCALLGIATATKIYPLAVLPAALAWTSLRAGVAAARRSLAAAVASIVAVYVVFVAVAPGGVWHSLEVQARRGLQKESLGASLLYVLDKLGLYKAHIVVGNPNWTELTGPAGDALALLGTVAEVAAVLFVAFLVVRRVPDTRTMVLAAAASVAGFVAFGKVFSPQYLIWLVPLVAATWLATRAAPVLLLVALALTRVWVPDRFDQLQSLNWITWIVLARNAVLVALFLVLVGVVRPALRTARAREDSAARRATRLPRDRTA